MPRRILLCAVALVLAAVTPAAVRADDHLETGVVRQALDLDTLPATLLLDVEDMIAVEAAIAAGPLARRPRDAAPEDPERFRLNRNLYVSAIVYLGPGDWTVWVNGNPVRPGPGAATPLFEVVEVTPRAVRLAVPWGEAGTRDVVLAAHQTFVPRRGLVVEGRW